MSGGAYGGTPSLVQVRVDFKENWGGAEPKQCCNVMVEATNPHRLFPTSMSYVYVGYKTEKFTLPVLHLTVLVRVTVLVR